MCFHAGQHTIRGATKEKSRKLDELKAKRKAKGDKKRVRSPFLLPGDCFVLFPFADQDELSEA